MAKRILLTVGALLVAGALGVGVWRVLRPEPVLPVIASRHVEVTPSVSPTATYTRTPRPTSTVPSTLTAVWLATPTPPAWPTINCPAITPNVNGSLTEWTYVTPVSLNYLNAAVVQPATPGLTPTATGTVQPDSNDISGSLFCAYSGSSLYFAGIVLDAVTTPGVTYDTAGSISDGDAVRITLDGNRDGLADVRGDDHDLYVSPSERVLDFDTYPISSTLAISDTATGYIFELGIGGAEIELTSPITPTQTFGLVWGLLDADTAAGLQHILSDVKRMATIQ